MNVRDYRECQQQLCRLIAARQHVIFVRTAEEIRASNCVIEAYEEALAELESNGLEVDQATSAMYRWNIFEGLQQRQRDKQGTENWAHINANYNPQRPIESVLDYLKRNLPGQKSQHVYLLADWTAFLSSEASEERATLSRKLQEVVLDCERLSKRPRMTLVIIGREWAIPAILRNSVYVLDLPLPTDRELYDDIFSNVQKRFALDEENAKLLASQAQGMTDQAARQCVRLIGNQQLWSNLSKASALMLEIKKQEIRKTGVLEYYAPRGNGLQDVGGLNKLKNWLISRQAWFRQDEEPHMRPRAILLEGFPGCGKTFIARALAQEWRIPQITFEISRLQSRYVGDTESNTNQALRAIEASAPNILFMDEIEKAFAGVGGDTSGVTTRQFGTFLSWLNDHEFGVFFIATSNDRSRLPPELFRAGRFDETFIIMPPGEKERLEILKQRRAFHSILDGECDEELVEKTHGFSGAEIDKLVKEARYLAGPSKQPGQKDWLVALSNIQPQYKGPSMQVLLRNYMQLLNSGAGLPASTHENGFLESLLIDNKGDR